MENLQDKILKLKQKVRVFADRDKKIRAGIVEAVATVLKVDSTLVVKDFLVKEGILFLTCTNKVFATELFHKKNKLLFVIKESRDDIKDIRVR